VSKREGRLSKETLYLQDNSAPHWAAIIHQILTDLHFDVLKYMAPLDYYYSLLTSRNTGKEEVLGHRRGHISCGQVVCSTAKRIFLGCVKELIVIVISMWFSGENM
jgi:hypothetical protein